MTTYNLRLQAAVNRLMLAIDSYREGVRFTLAPVANDRPTQAEAHEIHRRRADELDAALRHVREVMSQDSD